MHYRLMSLAVLAAFLSAPAQAQGMTAAQQEEAHCVLNHLSGDDQGNVAVMLLGEEPEASAAEAAVSPVLDAAVKECVARFGWDEAHSMAGEEMALTAVTFDAIGANVPAELATRLGEIMEGFPAEYAYAFSYEAQDSMDEEAVQAWLASAEKALTTAGIAQADMVLSIFYLNTLADVSMASAKWGQLFQVR